MARREQCCTECCGFVCTGPGCCFYSREIILQSGPVGGGTCAADICARYGGSHTLISSSAGWVSDEVGACGPGPLWIVTVGKLQMTARASSGAVYMKEPIPCDGPVTLDLHQSTGECDHPDTITIIPVRERPKGADTTDRCFGGGSGPNAGCNCVIPPESVHISLGNFPGQEVAAPMIVNNVCLYCEPFLNISGITLNYSPEFSDGGNARYYGGGGQSARCDRCSRITFTLCAKVTIPCTIGAGGFPRVVFGWRDTSDRDEPPHVGDCLQDPPTAGQFSGTMEVFSSVSQFQPYHTRVNFTDCQNFEYILGTLVQINADCFPERLVPCRLNPNNEVFNNAGQRVTNTSKVACYVRAGGFIPQ